MIYEKAVAEKLWTETQIELLQGELEKLPEGKLVCARNGKYSKWYWNDGKRYTYLPKSEQAFAKQLALKTYLSLQLTNLLQEKEAIESYLKKHDWNAIQAEQSLMNSPGFRELLDEKFMPFSQTLIDWMHAPYEKNTSHPENLIHRTYSGNLVRSKSESIIDMHLYKNKIPFRYEAILQLNKTILYPDFTIRHPRTGKYFYWEHFGLMDDPSYVKNVSAKHQLYISNGIIPNIQLITTYETKENPLSTEMVNKIVEYYFLD